MDGGYALGEGPLPPLPDKGQDMEAGEFAVLGCVGALFQEGNPQSIQCPNLSERKEAGEKEM